MDMWITKELAEDRIIDIDALLADELAYALGEKERPVKVPFAFPDAETALRALTGSISDEDGCPSCGVRHDEWEGTDHDFDCPWVASKKLIERLDEIDKNA